MDYLKLYNTLIDNRRMKGVPAGYIEVHHIVPRSFGGSNDPVNLIAMTAREHFIAHRLLAKIYPESGMVHAVFKMACSNKVKNRYKVTSRVYEKLRKDHAYRVSIDEVAKHKKSIAGKGKKQSKEPIESRVKSRQNNGPWHSDETKIKISESNSGNIGYWAGKTQPEEVVNKRNETRRLNGGFICSEEKKIQLSKKLKGVPKNRTYTDEDRSRLRDEKNKQVTCPHCGKQGTMLIMPRWHFDNCKQNPDNLSG